MSASDGETIAAIATAAGVGGVGIVRVSGPSALAIVAAAVGLAEPELGREVRLATVRTKSGERVDQVLVFAMRAPASFTGEDVAELHGHGGTHNLGQLLDAVLERGARIAEPGEFTRRALQHGKIDLLRAEALLAVIHAGNERAWRLAQRSLTGRLGEELLGLEGRALVALAEIEGRIDFPEDDLPDEDDRQVSVLLDGLARRCTELADGFRHARAVGEGIVVALVGPVNVGKSSLLNALVGKERAIVAPVPGTTRDFLEVRDSWGGVSVTIVDTAGTRETVDPIEARGIALGAARVESADVVVVINDGAAGWDDGARFGARALVVRSKADLGGETREALATSATTGAGLGELRTRALAIAGVAEREGREDAFIMTARQHGFAAEARDAFAAAVEARRARRPVEVVALEVRHGVRALAQLRGIEVGDRVLDEVFARFCIGK